MSTWMEWWPDPATGTVASWTPTAGCAAARGRSQQVLENTYLGLSRRSFSRPARRRCRATRCARAASSTLGAWCIRASPTRSRSVGCARPACGSIRSGMRTRPKRCSARSGRAVPAVLDGLRGVPEHPRQRTGRALPQQAPIARSSMRLALRRGRRDERRCFTDATIQAHLDQALDASRRHRRVVP